MTTVSFEEIKKAKKVLPFTEAYKILETTEPLSSYEFDTDGNKKVTFSVPQEWNAEGVDIQSKPSDWVTSATFSMSGGPSVSLTKEALLSATSSIGLNPSFAQRSPAPLIQAALNYWANNKGMGTSDKMKILVDASNTGVAFVRPTLSVFSNLTLVSAVVEKIEETFNLSADDLWVDYKIANDLHSTSFRLIVPEVAKSIQSARTGAHDPDDWSLGIQFTNSLSGVAKSPLSVSGYLFAWWCLNGSISSHATSGNYSRKTSGQDLDEVVDWITASTEQILAILPEELDDVESLTQVPLAGELNDTISDIFAHYKIPVGARNGIMDELVESNDLSGYGLMNSITQAGNNHKWADNVTSHVMKVGGAMPHVLTSRCSSCHRLQD